MKQFSISDFRFWITKLNTTQNPKSKIPNPKSQIPCPVCDRQEIEGDVCPNCETDLSPIRMLLELPRERKTIPLWLPIAITCLAVVIFLIIKTF